MKLTLAIIGALLVTPATLFAQAPPPSASQQQPPPKRPGEPTARPPDDPLAIPPEIQDKIGSDAPLAIPPAEGKTERTFYGVYYEEKRGDSRFRFIPPLYLEQTRGLPDHADRESFVPPLLYYQRRSEKNQTDIWFPLFWRVRSELSSLWAVGPLVHRDSPGEWDNMLAPLFFAGARKDGGYVVIPELLTFSTWSIDSAFTIAGLYFRRRSGTDRFAGVMPFYFYKDNGNEEGARKTMFFLPPLLTYHQESELDESSTTVVGPVIVEANPKRRVFDVAPFFFHIHGTPETGGIKETHTSFFPLFHYGKTPDMQMIATPLFLHRTAPGVQTTLTPFASFASRRDGASTLLLAGPVVPLFFQYRDKDVGRRTTGFVPLFYDDDRPGGHDTLTPLYGKFQTYGQSRSWWAFPSITHSVDQHGWSTNVYPLVFTGRNDESRHNVVAPLYWDFSSPNGRQTVAFPLFWRFTDTATDAVTQVVVNTLYTQKKVAKGIDWQFHFLPLFSFGGSPDGHFWNVLFGLTGYERNADGGYLKMFWAPIKVSGPVQTRAAYNQ